MLRTLAAAASCLMLVVTGCTGAGRQPAPASSGPPVYQGPELPRLITEEVPVDPDLWVQHTINVVTRLDENTLVVYGGNERGEEGFGVLDLTSGKQLWSRANLPMWIELPGVGRVQLSGSMLRGGDHAAGNVILLGYYQSSCAKRDLQCPENRRGMTDSSGVLAYSAADRRLRWSTPTLLPVPLDSQEAEGRERSTAAIVATTPKVVVVNMGGGPSGVRYEPGSEQVITMGLDPKTGRRLWELPNVLTQRVVDDLVLGIAMPEGGETDPTPLALDADDGRELWRLPSTETGRWTKAVPGLALLEQTDPAEPLSGRARMISLPRGETGPELPPAAVGLGTGQDGIPVAAWVGGTSTDPGNVQVWSQRFDNPSQMSGREYRESELALVNTVANGYVWTSSASQPWAVTALDQTGAARSNPLPGKPLHFDADLVVTATDGGGVRIWRYRPV
ncbi:hypothetical protein CGZ98_00540 [Enemella evansiae]|uniref:hypothetical protein n=1 Tax=Enemella evansiae TaxID=2016499 RepID=UPI000B961310|nr:hypothetical protein [Enemella evansiae]OYO14976.1 hypothetical protein CGZ98_00540 [Enemella evansiae]